jgi:hypothetical protein
VPGKQVKDWDMYHALREQGKSKESAARITNAKKGRKKETIRRRKIRRAKEWMTGS